MMRRFTLSDLAPDLGDAVLSSWHVGEGDVVKEGDDLVDVVTDKANVTIPSPFTGNVHRLERRENESITNADVILVMDNGNSD